MYTSGTTGDPKGVMITNNGIINVVVGMNRVLQESVNEPVMLAWRFISSITMCRQTMGFQLIDQFILLLCEISHTCFWNLSVQRKGCLFFISSSGTYIWSCDWGDSYPSWRLNRILAWGKMTNFFSFHKRVKDNNCRPFHLLGCQTIDWRSWCAETFYFLCCSQSIGHALYRYALLFARYTMLNSQILVRFINTVELYICSGFDHHAVIN